VRLHPGAYGSISRSSCQSGRVSLIASRCSAEQRASSCRVHLPLALQRKGSSPLFRPRGLRQLPVPFDDPHRLGVYAACDAKAVKLRAISNFVSVIGKAIAGLHAVASERSHHRGPGTSESRKPFPGALSPIRHLVVPSDCCRGRHQHHCFTSRSQHCLVKWSVKTRLYFW
jgi:hypothetical protein